MKRSSKAIYPSFETLIFFSFCPMDIILSLYNQHPFAVMLLDRTLKITKLHSCL